MGWIPIREIKDNEERIRKQQIEKIEICPNCGTRLEKGEWHPSELEDFHPLSEAYCKFCWGKL